MGFLRFYILTLLEFLGDLREFTLFKELKKMALKKKAIFIYSTLVKV